MFLRSEGAKARSVGGEAMLCTRDDYATRVCAEKLGGGSSPSNARFCEEGYIHLAEYIKHNSFLTIRKECAKLYSQSHNKVRGAYC